jgi:hypothetical protein
MTGRAAESEDPVAQSTAYGAGRPPDEVGDDNPHLLQEERAADESVGQEVALQGGLREEGGTRRAHEVGCDPDRPIDPARVEEPPRRLISTWTGGVRLWGRVDGTRLAGRARADARSLEVWRSLHGPTQLSGRCVRRRFPEAT